MLRTPFYTVHAVFWLGSNQRLSFIYNSGQQVTLMNDSMSPRRGARLMAYCRGEHNFVLLFTRGETRDNQWRLGETREAKKDWLSAIADLQ